MSLILAKVGKDTGIKKPKPLVILLNLLSVYYYGIYKVRAKCIR